MPRYDYRCNDCGEQFEKVQSFDEPALTTCPHCGQEGLRKLFGNVGVVFKGSGFYRNDSRDSGKKAASTSGDSSDSNSESSVSNGDGSSSANEKSGSATDKSGKTDSKQPAASKSTSSGGSTASA